MNKVEELLNENDSMKRLGLTAVTPLVMTYMSQHGVSENLILAFIAFMGSVIAGSNAHAVAKAKADAAITEALGRSPEETATALGGKTAAQLAAEQAAKVGGVLLLVLALLFSSPARAQDTVALDAPTLVQVTIPMDSVILSQADAKKKDAQCSADAAKVSVYEKTAPLPWWGAIIIAAVAAGVGVGVTVGIYEAAKKP